MISKGSIAAIHSQLSRADEAEHVVFIGLDKELQAVPVRRIVGFYQNPALEDLEEDVLHAESMK